MFFGNFRFLMSEQVFFFVNSNAKQKYWNCVVDFGDTVALYF
jgi:hypothetical protein